MNEKSEDFIRGEQWDSLTESEKIESLADAIGEIGIDVDVLNEKIDYLSNALTDLAEKHNSNCDNIEHLVKTCEELIQKHNATVKRLKQDETVIKSMFIMLQQTGELGVRLDDFLKQAGFDDSDLPDDEDNG